MKKRILKKIKDNYRTFSELLPKSLLWRKVTSYFSDIQKVFSMYFGRIFFVYFGILVVALSFVLLFSYKAYLDNAREYMKALESLSYWERVIEEHPNFPIGYYNAAYFAARLGRQELALNYVESSLYLDANSDEAQKLKGEILGM